MATGLRRTLLLVVGMAALCPACVGQCGLQVVERPIDISQAEVREWNPPLDATDVKAARLCEAVSLRAPGASSEETAVTSRPLPPGALRILIKGHDQPGFLRRRGLPAFLEALDVAQLQYVACVSESQLEVGTYTDQQGRSVKSALRARWDVSFVKWPEGSLLGVTSFLGPMPPPELRSSGVGWSPVTLGQGEDLEGQLRRFLLAAHHVGRALVRGADAPGALDETLYEFSPDGSRMVVVENRLADGHLAVSAKVFATADGALLQALPVLGDHNAYDVGLSADNRFMALRVASHESDGDFQLWDLTSGAKAWSVSGVWAWALTGDGRRAALARSGDGEGIQVWDLSRRTKEQTLGVGLFSNALAFSPDGSKLAVLEGGSPQRSIVFDLSTGKRIAERLVEAARRPIRFADERRVAQASGTCFEVWDIAARRVERFKIAVNDWSADVRYAVYGEWLYDLAAGRAIAPFPVKEMRSPLLLGGQPPFLRVSPTGMQVATVNREGVVTLYPVPGTDSKRR
jgi:hypothetical protein